MTHPHDISIKERRTPGLRGLGSHKRNRLSIATRILFTQERYSACKTGCGGSEVVGYYNSEHEKTGKKPTECDMKQLFYCIYEKQSDSGGLSLEKNLAVNGDSYFKN
jgi:hypothetical protein